MAETPGPEPPPAPRPQDVRPVRHPDDPRVTLDGYGVGRDGRVWGYDRRRRFWVPLVRREVDGHPFVRIVLGGRPRVLSVARLVLSAWVEPRPFHTEAFHYPDLSPANCRVENLRWAPAGTSRAGRGDAAKFGPPRKGESHGQSVLREGDVVEGRDLYRAGFSVAEVAAKFGVSPETARSFLTGVTWGHVVRGGGPVRMRKAAADPENAPTSKLDREAAAEIRRLSAAGHKPREIAERFGVTRGCVNHVLKGRTWAETVEPER